MNTKKLLSYAAALALGTLPVAASAQHGGGHGGHDQAAHAEHAAAMDAKPATGTVKHGVRTIELTVTKDGFTPAKAAVKKGEKVRLVVTRKVERTCATELVMKDYGINQPLPLDKAVVIEFTPTKSGGIHYACAMDMIGGELVVD
jgi:plastocyanin